MKLRASTGFKTWPEDAIAQFEARHAIGSKARLAFGLLLYTAERREYDTTVGTTPAATFTNATSIPLTLSDHAVFLLTLDAAVKLVLLAVFIIAMAGLDARK